MYFTHFLISITPFLLLNCNLIVNELFCKCKSNFVGTFPQVVILVKNYDIIKIAESEYIADGCITFARCHCLNFNKIGKGHPDRRGFFATILIGILVLKYSGTLAITLKDDMNSDDIYYSYDRLFSYNFLLAFVIGERGCGKTFGAKVGVLKKFLKTGEQFIYLRRYKTELDTALATFWNDLQENGYFEDYRLEVKKSKMLTEFKCNGKVCGYAVPLSTANILKSTAFPKVKTIIFDEFILDGASGTYRYLKNEVTMMLDVIETVGRLRDIQVLFLGNALSIVNPYFSYFELDLPYNGEFRTFKDGAIVVNYIKNLKYREAKKKSKFGKLIEDTDYGRYAIDNEMLRDNKHFIEKKPPNCTFWGVLVVNGNYIGMWQSKNGYMYLSNKFDPNTTHKFACDFNDHTEHTIFLNARENYYLKICVTAYKQGWLKFEDQKIKGNILPLLNKCVAF